MPPHLLRLIKVIIFVIIVLAIVAVYLKLFKRPPVDELMKMNKIGKLNRDFGAESFRVDVPDKEDNSLQEVEDNLKYNDNEDEKQEKEDSDNDKGDIQDNYWTHFIERNNFVPIGAVYDKCDGSKVQLGSVVLIENKEEGTLLARTFVNITLSNNVTGGTFFLKVKYNSKDLFENYWELCELEDELPVANKTFTCPIASGNWNRVKDKPIPGYLPAGRYQTKAWVVDEKEKTILCGFSDFSL